MFDSMKVVGGSEIKEYLHQRWWSTAVELGAPPWEEVPNEHRDNTKSIIDWLRKEKGIPFFSQARDSIIYGRPTGEPSDVKVEVWEGGAGLLIDTLVNDRSTFKQRRQVLPLLLKLGGTILVLRNKDGRVFGSVVCQEQLNGDAILVMSTTEDKMRTAMILASALGKEGWSSVSAKAEYGIDILEGVQELNGSFIIYAPGAEIDKPIVCSIPEGVINQENGGVNRFCESCLHRVSIRSCTYSDRHPVLCKECGGRQVRISSDEEENEAPVGGQSRSEWFSFLSETIDHYTKESVERKVNLANKVDPHLQLYLRLPHDTFDSLSHHQRNVAFLIMENDERSFRTLCRLLASPKIDQHNCYTAVWWAYMCTKWESSVTLPCPIDAIGAEPFAIELAPLLGVSRRGDYWTAPDGATAETSVHLVATELAGGSTAMPYSWETEW